MDRLRIKVHGHEVMTYSFGTGEKVLMLVHGGPGCPSNYLRDSHAHLVDQGFRIVTWDQLGCGESDKPTDRHLWQIPRFVEEMECVRKTLKLGKIHLLGQSWGGVLSLEYCLTYPQFVQSFIAANTAFNLPLMQRGFERLKLALGIETVTMMARREAEESTLHPEYQSVATILMHRHLCRAEIWPEAFKYSMKNIGESVFTSLFGKHFFNCTGSMRDYNRTNELHKLKMPCLILHGEYDEIIPELATMAKDHIPQSKLVIFRNCSHTPFFEDPHSYFKEITHFLKVQK